MTNELLLSVILHIVAGTLWAGINACLSLTFHHFCEPGMIFQKYGLWLEFLPAWIAKPLGRCIYCHNVWVNVAMFWAVILIGWITVSPAEGALILLYLACISNIVLYKLYNSVYA